MKKIVSLVLLVVLLVTGLVAVAEGTTDEFDVSADAAKVSELGIPTVSSVAELKSKADSLWKAGDYQAAAEAYSIYAKNANWLANLIAAGCEPFYGGSKDEQSNFSSYYKKFSYGGFFSTISNGESKSNSYKSERNRAMAYEALCYYKLGDYVTAVPLLTKALDVIEINQVEYWELCTNALYDIVGLK